MQKPRANFHFYPCHVHVSVVFSSWKYTVFVAVLIESGIVSEKLPSRSSILRRGIFRFRRPPRQATAFLLPAVRFFFPRSEQVCRKEISAILTSVVIRPGIWQRYEELLYVCRWRKTFQVWRNWVIARAVSTSQPRDTSFCNVQPSVKRHEEI